MTPAASTPQLRRNITLPDGITFVVSLMIGSGIFLKPQAVLANSGSAGVALLMWIAGGGITICPIEFLEKLAAIIPRPAVNLVVSHGLLAPHARWRSRVVRSGRPAPDVPAREGEASPRAAGTPGAWTWVALMRRVLNLDVLACPRCGGRLRVLATVQDPRAGQAILAHRARSGAPAPPGPAPPAPAALP